MGLVIFLIPRILFGLAVEVLGSNHEEVFRSDQETMNGFLFTKDNVVGPGFAVSVRPVDENAVTRLVTVISLNEDAYSEAVEFAKSYPGVDDI